MKNVTVLMSTYNGERYLKKQIDSILNQKNVNVTLSIRDDGSSDGTIKILKKLQSNSKVIIEFGENLGWKKSFFELLKNTSLNRNSFYAFADQDDIWDIDKLSVGIKCFTKGKPIVYYSNVNIVDDREQILSERFSRSFVPTKKLPEAFFDSLALGCTMIFNSEILELVKIHIPTVATQHDAYVLALGYLFGNVVYDANSHMKYRRHGNAASGFKKISQKGHPSLLMRYKKYKNSPKHSFSIRANEIVKGYQELLSEQQLTFLKKIADYSINFQDKIFLIFSFKIKATGIRRTLQVKYRVIFNTL